MFTNSIILYSTTFQDDLESQTHYFSIYFKKNVKIIFVNKKLTLNSHCNNNPDPF